MLPMSKQEEKQQCLSLVSLLHTPKTQKLEANPQIQLQQSQAAQHSQTSQTSQICLPLQLEKNLDSINKDINMNGEWITFTRKLGFNINRKNFHIVSFGFKKMFKTKVFKENKCSAFPKKNFKKFSNKFQKMFKQVLKTFSNSFQKVFKK